MALDPRLRPLLVDFATGEGPALCSSFEAVLFELRQLKGDQALAAWVRASRSVHTLKGSAASLELEGVARLARELETALAPLKTSPSPLRADQLDALLEAAALIRGQLAGVISWATNARA